MDKVAEVERIIKEYRESRQQIRSIIKEYEEQELRLFSIMLSKLKNLDNYNTPSHSLRSEHLRTLD